MSECKHSWCKECDSLLEKNNFKKCPLCKTAFKRVLQKGKWYLDTTSYGSKWVYEEGISSIKPIYDVSKFVLYCNKNKMELNKF